MFFLFVCYLMPQVHVSNICTIMFELRKPFHKTLLIIFSNTILIDKQSQITSNMSNEYNSTTVKILLFLATPI